MTVDPASSPVEHPAARPRWTLAVWIASGAGVGLSPVMPGTCGALLGVPLAWMIAEWTGQLVGATLILLMLLVAIPICTRAARQRGGAKDPSWIVLDEIVSIPITLFAIPLSLGTVLLGFVLNRVFDILKPAPARQLEHLPDGLGVVADDVVAGIYSNLALRAVLWAVAWVSAGG